MKYYIIIGLVIAAFTFLWFTKDVNAAVIDKPTEPQDTITGVLVSNNGRCITYQENHMVGKDLQPFTKSVCH